MSYCKFRLKDTGHIFHYQNTDNGLYDDQFNLLSLPPEKAPEWYESVQPLFGVTHKNNRPVALRILLGHACNYSCSYCMQKDIGNPDERPENIYARMFVKSLEKLDLTDLERIELWGGEPFLYWKDIERIMPALDKKGRHFYISTNGSALRQKHVDFFKSLEASVMLGISHDGPGQEALRGEDILHKENIISVLKQFDDMYPKIQYSFNPVVSKQNYDLFKINDFFRSFVEKHDIKNGRISFTLGRTYDETDSKNSTDHVITGDDLPLFKDIVKRYMDACIDQLKTQGRGKRLPILQSNIFDGTTGVLQYALKTRKQVPITYTSNCGADSADVLSIDIQGNVRLCPHTSEKYIGGHINDLKGVKIIPLALDRKKTHCAPCPVKRLCKSSCPIDFPDTTFLKNCAVEKIWYGAIQQASFKMIFNEDVELLEVGIESRYSFN
jgi:uncharacterized protein